MASVTQGAVCVSRRPSPALHTGVPAAPPPAPMACVRSACDKDLKHNRFATPERLACVITPPLDATKPSTVAARLSP
eukprot:8901416-Pyramimonas_sp.AAC.1